MTTMPVYEMVDTWNAAGTVFTAIGMNVTDNLSASGSMLIDLQVGGTSQFHVTKFGVIHGKRANFNIASANAPIVSVSNYSLTGSNADSLFDLAGTWNTSGTPTALKLNITDTASAAASLLLDLQVGGTSRFSVAKNGYLSWGTSPVGFSVAGAFSFGLQNQVVVLRDNGALGWASDGNVVGTSPDTILTRDAANTLAQRNSTNAQTFRIYNTFTDASNYERGRVGWETNTFVLGAQAAGTGTNRTTYLTSSGGTSAAQVRIGTDASGGRIWFTPANLSAWEMTSSGHFLAGADNTYDIGASGANRPRNVFWAGYQEMSEMTAPAAPAANGVRIYAIDNGSGKTQLMALFATGAAVQIAIEP